MSPDADIVHTFSAFGGALCEIRSLDGDACAVSTAIEDVYTFESILTRFDAASELSRFNASAGARAAVSPLLEAILRASVDAFTLTDGLVNAAIGNHMIAAGYDRTITQVREAPGRRAPSQAAIPLSDVLNIGPGWAQLDPLCALDFGGIGKGWLADTLIERFDNAVVNLGGDLRVRGRGEDGLGWVVQMCDGSSIRVHDGGVATSGIGSRRWAGGHHILDPRTGRPALVEADAISVAAPTALAAEVLAKAALIRGNTDLAAWLNARGAVAHAALMTAVA